MDQVSAMDPVQPQTPADPKKASLPRPSGLPTLKKPKSGASGPVPDENNQLVKEKSIVSSASQETDRILTSDTDSFIIGDTVWVGGIKRGKIAFIGETQFAKGEWAGVVLDEPTGKNDGTVSGVRYFQCDALHGTFTRLTRLSRKPLIPIDPSKECEVHGSTPPRCLVERQRSPSPLTSPGSGVKTPFRLGSPTPSAIKIGERVIVQSGTGTKRGVLKFIGKTEFADGEWAGIELDQSVGKNDGAVQGKRYFQCKANHGLFAPVNKVSSSPANRRPSSSLRRHGSKESVGSNVSSYMSTASRTPIIRSIRKPLLSQGNGNKCLPTCSLQPVLREMEIHIDQLIQEKEFDRQELAQLNHLISKRSEENEGRAELTKSADELRSQVVRYKLELDAQKRTNETLVLGLDELNRKMDDLQFAYEEEKILRNDLQSQLEVVLSEGKVLPDHGPELAKLNMDLKEKMTTLLKLEGELNGLKATLGQKDSQITTLEGRCIHAQTMSSELINESNRLKIHHKESEDAGKKLLLEIHGIERKSREEIDTMKKEIQDLKNRLEVCRNNETVLVEQKSKFEFEAKELQFGKEELEILLKAAEENAAALTKNNAVVANGQLKKYETEIEKLQLAQTEWETKLKASEDNKSSLINEFRQIETELKLSYENKLCELQLANDKLGGEIVTTAAEKEFLIKTKEISLSEERQQYESQISKILLAKEELEIKLKVSEDNVTSLVKKFEDSVVELKSSYEIKLTQLQTNIDQLVDELGTKSTDNEQLFKTKNDSLSAQKQKYELEISEILLVKDKLETKVISLEENEVNLLKKFECAVSEINSYKDRIQQLQFANNEVIDELKKSTEGIESLTKAKNDAVSGQTQQFESQLSEILLAKSELESKLKKAEENGSTLVKTHEEIVVELKLFYENKLTKLQLATDALMVQLQTISLENASLSKAKENSVLEEKQKYESHLSHSQLAKDELESKLKIFEEKESILLKNYEQTKSELNESESKLKQLQLVQEELISELNTWRVEKDTLLQSKENLLAEQKENFEKEIFEIILAKNELESKLKTAEEHESSLIKNYEEITIEMKSSHDTKIIELQMIKDSFTKQLESIAADKVLVKAKEESLSEENQKYASHLSQIQLVKDELELKLKEFEKKESELVNKFEHSMSELNTSEEQLKELQLTKKDLMNELEISRVENQNLLQTKEKLVAEQKEIFEREITEIRLTNEKLEMKLKESERNGARSNKSIEKEISESGDSRNIDFLNSIIVDLNKKNEELKLKLEILISGEPLPDHNRNMVAKSGSNPANTPTRVYCDICEEFDIHETEECPTQSSEPDPNSHNHGQRGTVREYCTNCEVFGHSTADCDDGETY